MVSTCTSGFGADEDQGDQVIVPDPQELEDGKGSQRRERERQDQPGEDGEVRSAIQEGGFEDITRQGADVVEQQVSCQRKPKPAWASQTPR